MATIDDFLTPEFAAKFREVDARMQGTYFDEMPPGSLALFAAFLAIQEMKGVTEVAHTPIRIEDPDEAEPQTTGEMLARRESNEW